MQDAFQFPALELLTQRGAGARQTRDQNGPRDLQYARGLRIGEAFQDNEQQSLPFFECKVQQRGGKIIARRGGEWHFPGGAPAADIEIFLFQMCLSHVSLGAQPSRR